MRVTNSMMYRVVNESIRRATLKLAKSQEQVSTGKRVNRPSDDPVDAGDIVYLRTDISKLNQFLRNNDRANAILTTSDSALQSISDILTRAKSLAVQAANDATLSQDDRMQIATELTGVLEEFIDLANTKYSDQYIFSGYKVGTQTLTSLDIQATPGPGNSGNAEVTSTRIVDIGQYTFDNYTIEFTSPPNPPEYVVINQSTGGVVSTGTYTSGEEITFDGFAVTISDLLGPPLNGDVFEVITDNVGEYQGDANGLQVEIDDGLVADISLTGDRVFKGEGGGIDIAQTFVDLIKALRADDTDAINDSLTNLDTSQDQILNYLAVIGTRSNEVDNISNRITDLITVQKTVLSNIEDADLIEAASQLSNDQIILQATLQVNANILKISLLNYL